MTIPIKELVDVIRSKNAGPYELTFDIIFKDQEGYEKVKKAQLINKELVSQLYKMDKKDIVSIIDFDPAKAIKITIKRPIPAGSPGERDVYGAQQYAPLLSIEI